MRILVLVSGWGNFGELEELVQLPVKRLKDVTVEVLDEAYPGWYEGAESLWDFNSDSPLEISKEAIVESILENESFTAKTECGIVMSLSVRMMDVKLL